MMTQPCWNHGLNFRLSRLPPEQIRLGKMTEHIIFPTSRPHCSGRQGRSDETIDSFCQVFLAENTNHKENSLPGLGKGVFLFVCNGRFPIALLLLVAIG